MQNTIHSLRQRLQRQLRKIEVRIQKALGQADSRRLGHLMAQLRRLEQRLASSSFSLKAAAGTAILGLALAAPQEASAQSFAAPVQNPFGFEYLGRRTKPAFVDIDNDGDLDAFVGEFNGNTRYFENTGNAASPAFAPLVLNPFGLAFTGFFGDPTLVDIDGDGDFDFFNGELYGNTYYFENTGTVDAPAFAAAVANPFGLADIGSEACPAFADLDGDGDFDAMIGANNGSFVYFQNTGTSNAPAFAASIANPFGLVSMFASTTPEFADMDGDGDLDLLTGRNNGDIVYFQNTGTSDNPVFGAMGINPFGIVSAGVLLSPTPVDLDADGDLDIVTGEYDGHVNYLEQGVAVTLSKSEGGTVYGPFVVTIAFSEGVSGLLPRELVVENGELSNPVVVSDSLYQITVTPTTGTEISIMLPSNQAQAISGGAGNAASNTITVFHAGVLAPCLPNAASAANEWIQRVKILQGTTPILDNISGRDGGYANFDGLGATSLDQSGTYTLAVHRRVEPGGEARMQAYRAWIDFNRDGDFFDAGENVMAKAPSTQDIARSTFTVPANAMMGQTRLRVQMKFGQIPFSPCESFAQGETEDYLIETQEVFVPFRTGAGLAKGLDVAENGLLSVYPNPASGTAQLQFEGRASVAVFSLDGRLVHQAEGENGYALDVTGLEAGLYVVAVTDAQGLRQTAKLAVE